MLPRLSVLALALIGAAEAATVSVPADFPDVQDAIDAAVDGDTIEISEGTYDGPLEFVGRTLELVGQGEVVIDGGGASAVIALDNSDVKIDRVTIEHGNDGVSTEDSRLELTNSVVRQTEDGIDAEDGTTLIVTDSIFIDSGDDAIDLDNDVSAYIARNVLRGSDDDGIEIRMQPYTGPTLEIVIERNRIEGSGRDAIQIIDYNTTTDRSFRIARNILIDSGDAGLGMMADTESRENLEGAPIEEPIDVVHNSFIGNGAGMTGGRNVAVAGNIFSGNTAFATAHLDGSSAVSGNLYFDNGGSGEGSDDAAPVFGDPILNSAFAPSPGSPAIDAGVADLVLIGRTVLSIPRDGYAGSAPDIGAIETGDGVIIPDDGNGQVGGEETESGSVMLLVAEDSEEKLEPDYDAGGRVETGSNDLDFQPGRAVALRFTGVDIPQGASIISAHVQLTRKRKSADDIAVFRITAEDADNAGPLMGDRGDISARAVIDESLIWAPDQFVSPKGGPDQRIDGLEEVIGAIVGREGWQSGNALVLIGTSEGEGKRAAYSIETSRGRGREAQLVVEYEVEAL